MDFCFYLITDRNATHGGRPVEYVLERALESGVRGVLLREKDLPDDELIRLALRVRELTVRHGVRMLVSGRPDVAAKVGADGVHLTSASPDIAGARAVVGRDGYVAVSTHNLAEALSAEEGGADFITFGPVFNTPSKEKYGPPPGVAALEEVCHRLAIPVFALGGMKHDNAAAALRAGAYGIAVISAVISAEDPGLAAENILDRIRSFKLGKMI